MTTIKTQGSPSTPKSSHAPWSSVPPAPKTQRPTATGMFLVTIVILFCFLISRVSYKRNHTECSLLSLASLTQQLTPTQGLCRGSVLFIAD